MFFAIFILKECINQKKVFSLKKIFLTLIKRRLLLLPEASRQAGEEFYQYSLTPGGYIIAVVIDGNINAQKVIVK